MKPPYGEIRAVFQNGGVMEDYRWYLPHSAWHISLFSLKIWDILHRIISGIPPATVLLHTTPVAHPALRLPTMSNFIVTKLSQIKSNQWYCHANDTERILHKSSQVKRYLIQVNTQSYHTTLEILKPCWDYLSHIHHSYISMRTILI